MTDYETQSLQIVIPIYKKVKMNNTKEKVNSKNDVIPAFEHYSESLHAITRLAEKALEEQQKNQNKEVKPEEEKNDG